MKKIISKNELKNQKKLKSGNLILFFALCGISLGFLGCKETSLVLVEGTTIDGPVENSEVFIEGRRVVISDFYISNHEVTQEEYSSVMGRNPSYFSRNPPVNEEQENRPVECVNWYDAIVYCNKRSLAEGLIPCYSLNGSKNPSDWGIIPSIFSQESLLRHILGSTRNPCTPEPLSWLLGGCGARTIIIEVSWKSGL